MSATPEARATVRRDPRLEPAAFRWPADRPVPTGLFGIATVAAPSWERWAQRTLLVGGLALSAWIYLVPAATGLSAAGKSGFAIFTLCTTLWVTQALPYGITGLLAVTLLGLTGTTTPAAAFSAFGSSAVFFLLGIFILAAGLVETGLSKRCALLFLRPFERSPRAFASGLLFAAVFGTICMPNQATIAMLFPIALEVAAALGLRPLHSSYAKVLFLSLAWGAMIGSNASFLGSTRAPLALGMLQQKYGQSIGFVEWTVAAFPVVLLGALLAPVVLRLSFRPERVDFSAARAALERAVGEMGPMQRRQWLALAILVATVVSWITLNPRVDLAIIAILGATALFVTGTITWEQAERRIYWNIVLMYGGAIALGVVIDRTGAGAWLLAHVVGSASVSPFVAIAGVIVATLLLSEFMSNAAAVAVMLPLAFGLGDQAGAAPVAVVLATSIGAGLDFALPFSSAPNTVAFASGYLRMKDVIRAGGLMTIVSMLVVLLVARFWWPLVGVP